MASTTESEIAVLNDLIEVTLDSVKGYEDAAEQARGDTITSIFTRRAFERRAVVGQLQDLVRTLGGTPESEDSLLARAHRMFLELKTIIAGRDDKAVLHEVDRGETYLRDRWQSALNQNLPSDLHATLSRLFDKVKAGQEQARSMDQSIR